MDQIKYQDVFHHSWPLAVVTEVHPGLDGQIQTVTLRTYKGTYKRPVVKLVLLIPEGHHSLSSPPHLHLERMFKPTLNSSHTEQFVFIAMSTSLSIRHSIHIHIVFFNSFIGHVSLRPPFTVDLSVIDVGDVASVKLFIFCFCLVSYMFSQLIKV